MRKLALFFFILSPLIIFSQPLSRFQYSHQQMGTQFHLIFYASDSTLARNVAHSAFARIDELNQILSDYQADSELNQLASTAGTDQWISVSDELWQVLKWSQQYASLSQGAFDITVGAVTKLWRRAVRRQQFPDAELLHFAKAKIGHVNILLNKKRQKVKLLQKGMRLDLGGIAKGYTVDQVIQVLQDAGIENALVDGGGDIRVSDAPPDTNGWKIEKKRIGENGKMDSVIVLLENAAIATSGDRYKYLVWDGKRYSHLIDPRIGIGVNHRRLVTVIAKTCTEADALASVFSVVDEVSISELINELDNIELQILKPSGAGNWELLK